MKLTGFEGASALVTGAKGGIGQVMVEMLRAAGTKVMATDIDIKAKDEAGLLWRNLDVRDRRGIEKLLQEIERKHGPLSLVVHAAGRLSSRPIMHMHPEEWQNLIDVNAGGTLNILSATGAHMAPYKRGSIVVIGSNAGGIPRLGIGAYGASKAAAAMLTRCAGLELAQFNIRCNLVAPGSTLTPMLQSMWQNPNQDSAAVIAGNSEAYRTGIPLGKLAKPEDIANAAMFLLSDQAGHVTMADLYVDGGATLRA